jgi:hypothetical protein
MAFWSIADSGSSSQDIVYTQIKMMAYKGITYVTFVVKFLNMYPEIQKIPALRPSILEYYRSMLSLMPLDPHLRPYYKAIQGDKTSIFSRDIMQPLIACSVAVLSITDKTLANFVISGDHSAVIAAVNRMIKIKEKKAALEEAEYETDEEDEYVEA